MADRKRIIYEDIVDDLMAKIQSGVLQAGTKLPAERTLAKEFGVSRAVVRGGLPGNGKDGLCGVLCRRNICKDS